MSQRGVRRSGICPEPFTLQNVTASAITKLEIEVFNENKRFIAAAIE
jgi:hypothetical protein